MFPRAGFTGDPSDTRSAATWQTIEEYDEATTMPTASYIHGNFIDEVLSMRRADGSGIVRDYYYHQDDLFNVTLVTDASGAAVERYDYGDYGTPRFFDGGGSALGASAIGNQRLFNGREWDAEVALYHYRTRYLEPSLGRFTARDHLGIWRDRWNHGNSPTFVASCPFSCIDVFGFETRRLNRELNPNNDTKLNPTASSISHTLVYTTNPDGTLKHTYSWGNTYDSNGCGVWHKDRPEDQSAAEKVIRLRTINKEQPSSSH